MTTIVRVKESNDFGSWLAACGEADPAAVGAFYDHYRPMLERFARRQGAGDPEGIADLAFFDGLRAIENLRSRSERSFRAYLFRSATSRIASERRKSAVELTCLGDDEPLCPSANLDEVIVESNWVRGLVGSLSSDQQEVINDRFFVGYSTAETARRLGKSPGAVRKLQHDAIARLRRAVFVVGAVLLVLGAFLALAQRERDNQIIVDAPPVDRSPSEISEDDSRTRNEIPPPTISPDGAEPSPAMDQAATAEAGREANRAVSAQRSDSGTTPDSTPEGSSTPPTTAAGNEPTTTSITSATTAAPTTTPSPPTMAGGQAPALVDECEVDNRQVEVEHQEGVFPESYYFFGANRVMLYSSDELTESVGERTTTERVWSEDRNPGFDGRDVRYVASGSARGEISPLVRCDRDNGSGDKDADKNKSHDGKSENRDDEDDENHDDEDDEDEDDD